jgi:single-stranded-DNA-specific exonuclease
LKFLRRTKREINENFLENLLIDRGILEDNEGYKNRYFNPTAKELLSPELLDNMKEGKELLEKHIKNNSTILIIMDSDLDGVASSTIIYNYLSMLKVKEGYEYILKYLIPEGKEHGLETKMDLFLKDKAYDLIIIPDAGSNDTEECKILKDLGYDILILD